MKDETGKVLIPGFYEGVSFSESDLKAMASVPESLDQIKDELGIAEAEKVGNSYQEAMQFPSLNIRGMRAAWVGKEVRTIIPSEAIIEIDMRTVKETPAERQVELVRKFISDQGFYIIDGEPSDADRKAYSKLISFDYRIGSEPFRAEMESEFGHWLEKGMSLVFGNDYIKTRLTGGSQPMAPFINILGVPAVSVRIPNPDNSIHGPNENIRIGNYLEGIQTCLGILTQSFD
jgi:acetylornithine deacetylase/succinyl-diaminopimelate desuccinylase-like protein